MEITGEVTGGRGVLVFHRKSPPEIPASLKASYTAAQALYDSIEIHIGTSLELEYTGLGRATSVTGLLHDSGHISLTQKLSVLTITRVAFCSLPLSLDHH